LRLSERFFSVYTLFTLDDDLSAGKSARQQQFIADMSKCCSFFYGPAHVGRLSRLTSFESADKKIRRADLSGRQNSELYARRLQTGCGRKVVLLTTRRRVVNTSNICRASSLTDKSTDINSDKIIVGTICRADFSVQ